MAPVFCVILLLTVVITNVPLRGLWSFLVLLMFVVIALLITLVPRGWDDLLKALGNLHIYINMAGYLFIATVVFILWGVSVFVFDQRTYLIVTPGQIQVCEHVGASIRSFDTTGLTFEKQRDDLFRHWLLGFFSGDLIVRTSGAERETIRLPNVLWIGWRLEEVQTLLREKATVSSLRRLSKKFERRRPRTGRQGTRLALVFSVRFLASPLASAKRQSLISSLTRLM